VLDLGRRCFHQRILDHAHTEPGERANLYKATDIVPRARTESSRGPSTTMTTLGPFGGRIAPVSGSKRPEPT
jgi:hypothetical protein